MVSLGITEHDYCDAYISQIQMHINYLSKVKQITLSYFNETIIYDWQLADNPQIKKKYFNTPLFLLFLVEKEVCHPHQLHNPPS